MDPSGIEPLYLNAVNPFTGNQYSKAYLELYKKRTELPVWRHKTEFMRALDDHKCILLEAETGSGKTTQVPQWCMEWWKKRHPHTQSMVCCTQPRRLATVSVAERVAKELDVPLRNVVGYSIRFEELVDSGTLLKYCTDGVLLAESSRDEILMRYGVILLDEVHERTMITDVVMGLVKRIMALRPNLRVVVMSATLKTGKFADYFSTHYSMQISGRSFSVKINFSDWDIIMDPEEYVKKSVEKAIEIHKKTNKRDDDILLFLSGQDEVESACELLEKEADKCKESGELKILPLFGSMQNEHLQMLEDTRQKDKKNDYRRCIVATNVAETSMTIDGIVFVIDPGFCKRKIYNPRTKLESLAVLRISRASAVQRAGRAGRTRPGICFRLYTEHCYDKIMKEIVPEVLMELFGKNEILTKNVAHNILKALLAGSFMKMAYFCPNASGLQRNTQSGFYVTVESHINLTRNEDDPVEQYLLHGSSVLFKGAKEYSSKPEWVLFNEAMQHNNNSNNQRCFLQTVSKIRPEWLAELAPAYRRQISLKSTALDEKLRAHEKANKTSAAQNLQGNELRAFAKRVLGISL